MKKLLLILLPFVPLLPLVCLWAAMPAEFAPEKAGAGKIADSLGVDPIEVYSTRTRVNRNAVPLNISVIGREQFENSGESSLLPVLGHHVPGLFVTQKGITGFGISNGAAGTINIRGVGGGTQVLMLRDGEPQWAGLFGHALPDMFSASDAERVEVIRGPGSLIYGSNAMGGAVNVITRQPMADGSQTHARLLFGSYNTQKYQLSNGYRSGRFSSFISVNHDRTDGHRENSGFRLTNGTLNLGYKINDRYRLTANASVAGIHNQNPGEVNNPIVDNIMDIIRGSASVALENTHAKRDGAVRLFYSGGRHKIDDGHKPGSQPQDKLFNSKDHNFGVVAYQTFRPFKGSRLTAGVDYKNWGGHAWYTFRNDDPNKDIVRKTVNETAGYLILNQDFTKILTLSAGVRYEYNSVFGGVWVPQAGFSLRPTATTTLKASFSKGFRSPNIREMYMFFPQNPNLRPENMLCYDVTIGQTMLSGRLSAELTAFFIDGRNMIENIFVDGRYQNRNTGKFINKGIEFSMAYRILPNLRLDANYSYLDTSIPLLAAPRHKAFAGITYNPGRFSLNVNVQTISRLYTQIPTMGAPTIENNFTLLGARVSYHIGPRDRGINIFLKGENLTSAKYCINYGFPMPKAVVFGGIDVNF